MNNLPSRDLRPSGKKHRRLTVYISASTVKITIAPSTGENVYLMFNLFFEGKLTVVSNICLMNVSSPQQRDQLPSFKCCSRQLRRLSMTRSSPQWRKKKFTLSGRKFKVPCGCFEMCYVLCFGLSLTVMFSKLLVLKKVTT